MIKAWLRFVFYHIFLRLVPTSSMRDPLEQKFKAYYDKFLVRGRVVFRYLSRLLIFYQTGTLPAQFKSTVKRSQLRSFNMVLIPQIQRSGGSLLSQLFDGHPEVWSYPLEFTGIKCGIGRHPYFQRKRDPFSYLDLWLYHLREGVYKKIGSAGKALNKDEICTPKFHFSMKLYRRVFNKHRKGVKNKSFRSFMDVYFSAMYESILSQKRYVGLKYVCAFSPRALSVERDMDLFVDAYPDGKVIWIIRDPFTWYASAKKHSSRYSDLERSMGEWSENVKAALKMRAKYHEHIRLINFSSLLIDTSSTMAHLARFLQITFSERLLVPTFNNEMLTNDSSYEVTQGVVNKAPIENRLSHLTEDEKLKLESRASRFVIKEICDF